MAARHLAWLVLLLLALAPPPGMSRDEAEILEIRARIAVSANMYSREEIQLTYLGKSGAILGDEFLVPGKVSELKVTDMMGNLDHSVSSSPNLTLVKFLFRSPLREGDRKELKISYVSSNFTSKSGTSWGYATVFTAGSEVNDWTVTVELPEEVRLYLPAGDGTENLTSIYYKSGKTYCQWTSSHSSRLFIAIAHSPLAGNDDGPWLIYVGLGVIIVVVGLVVYLLGDYYRSQKPEKTDLAVKLLDGRERRVVRELSDGKSATQAELVKATKLSKATISRAVVSLERRGIVEREKSGRVKRVTLSDWLLD